jgi:hypothetical protein
VAKGFVDAAWADQAPLPFFFGHGCVFQRVGWEATASFPLQESSMTSRGVSKGF